MNKCEVAEGARMFVRGFLDFFPNSIKSTLCIPTALRESRLNHNNPEDHYTHPRNNPSIMQLPRPYREGATLGHYVGAVASYAGIFWASNELKVHTSLGSTLGNATPFAVLGATNLASEIFERVRKVRGR